MALISSRSLSRTLRKSTQKQIGFLLQPHNIRMTAPIQPSLRFLNDQFPRTLFLRTFVLQELNHQDGKPDIGTCSIRGRGITDVNNAEDVVGWSQCPEAVKVLEFNQSEDFIWDGLWDLD